MALLHKKKKVKPMQPRVDTLVSPVCTEVTRKEETEHCVHLWHLEDMLLFPLRPGAAVLTDTWWWERGKKELSQEEETFLFQTDGTEIQPQGCYWTPLWILWDCFSQLFSSQISKWRDEGKKQLVFPFSFVRRSQKPVWIPSWRWRGLTMLFLVASGRLSFVNLLWPLYYLVCIILTAN